MQFTCSVNCVRSANLWVYDLVGLFEVAKCMYFSFFMLALFTFIYLM